MTRLRCAIYTRKSSEEGLEQDFNSLDAQREACAAYILSQASEGWSLVDAHYDDGGLSGGTLERPALQQLLADIAAGCIDIVVVYKVDRLTRSLIDFARLVEAMDAGKVSFVSVTQSFNTTTSMGRLTLNMLLSFAQFEREVTAERIRDKIAASKAKGMWMGGIPPLGYEPRKRSLAIVADHAELIRTIYRRYLELGNVRLLAEALENEGTRVPVRETRTGKSYGGGVFARGQLYAILRNPIYTGRIAHKGAVHPGNHAAIVDDALWNAVQQQLADNTQGTRRVRERKAAPLAGLLFDAQGQPLVPVHTSKPDANGGEEGRKRYRYYVSKAHHHGRADANGTPLRIPAPEIEQLVRQQLGKLFEDPLGLATQLGIALAPEQLETANARSEKTRGKLGRPTNRLLKRLLDRVIVHRERVELVLHAEGIAGQLQLPTEALSQEQVTIDMPVRLTRTGHVMRYVQRDGAGVSEGTPNPALVRLLHKAQRWWEELSQGERDITELAAQEQVTPSYVTRVVRLAFLAPDVVEAILDNRALAELDAATLMQTGAIDPDWRVQRARFLPAPLARLSPSAGAQRHG